MGTVSKTPADGGTTPAEGAAKHAEGEAPASDTVVGTRSGGSGPGSALVVGGIGLLCLIWGSTWLVIKGGLRDLPPFTSAGVRFLLAGLVMSAIAPALVRREGGRPPTLGLTVAMGALNFGGSYGVVYWSETVLPSGLVSLLWSVFPMMMAIGGHLTLPGERLRSTQWLGFLAGFGGVLLLFATDVRAIGPAAIPAGLILLTSPLVATIGNLYVKQHGRDTSSILLNRNGMWLGGVLLMLFAVLFERDAEMRWTTAAISSIVYLSILGTVVTFGVYFWLMRFAPAYQLSLIAYIVPAFALLLGYLVGGEAVTTTTLIGAGTILGGVALVLRAPPKEKSS